MGRRRRTAPSERLRTPCGSSIMRFWRSGTLKAWAEELGMRDAVQLLDATLQEEKRTDALLSRIAEERVNQRAA